MIFLSIWASWTKSWFTYFRDKKEKNNTHTPIQPSFLFFAISSRFTFNKIRGLNFFSFFFLLHPWCFLCAIVSEIILYAVYLNSSLLSSIFIWKTKTFRFNIWTAMVHISCERKLKTHLGGTNFHDAVSKTFFLSSIVILIQKIHTHIHIWDFIEDEWMENNRIAISPPTHQKNKIKHRANFRWIERASFTSELIFYVDIVVFLIDVRWKGSSLKLETTKTLSEAHFFNE